MSFNWWKDEKPAVYIYGTLLSNKKDGATVKQNNMGDCQMCKATEQNLRTIPFLFYGILEKANYRGWKLAVTARARCDRRCALRKSVKEFSKVMQVLYVLIMLVDTQLCAFLQSHGAVHHCELYLRNPNFKED